MFGSDQAPTLKIAGRSGCTIDIAAIDARLCVTKSASRIDYNDRLVRQVGKQRLFGPSFPEIRWFQTPEILADGVSTAGFQWFRMAYVSGEKATAYFAEADVATLHGVRQKFAHYFNTIEQGSVPVPPPLTTIHAKNAQLCAVLTDKSALEPRLASKLCSFLQTAIPDAPILQGYCHGDFTISNMLFDVWHIYLFDFLDSFIESPLIDLIKLRQDTRFGWTLLLDEQIEPYHANRAKIALHFIDQHLAARIQANPFYSAWHDYLEVYNLARIVPYVQTDKELAFLEKNLGMLLQH